MRNNIKTILSFLFIVMVLSFVVTIVNIENKKFLIHIKDFKKTTVNIEEISTHNKDSITLINHLSINH